MIRRHVALAAGLALMLSASLAAPGLAQTLAAQSGRIIELTRAGKYSDALPLALVMVASLESNNTRDLAGALNNLGQVYAGQGHDDQAEPLYKRAIALTEKSLGLDAVGVAANLTNLAAVYQRQGLFTEAEPLFQRALAIREKRLPREHFD